MERHRRTLQEFVRSLSVIVDPVQLHGVIAGQLREIFASGAGGAGGAG